MESTYEGVKEQLAAEVGINPTVEDLFKRLIIERRLLIEEETAAEELQAELDKRQTPVLWATRNLEGDIDKVTEEEPLHYVVAYSLIKPS